MIEPFVKDLGFKEILPKPPNPSSKKKVSRSDKLGRIVGWTRNFNNQTPTVKQAQIQFPSPISPSTMAKINEMILPIKTHDYFYNNVDFMIPPKPPDPIFDINNSIISPQPPSMDSTDQVFVTMHTISSNSRHFGLSLKHKHGAMRILKREQINCHSTTVVLSEAKISFTGFEDFSVSTADTTGELKISIEVSRNKMQRIYGDVSAHYCWEHVKDMTNSRIAKQIDEKHHDFDLADEFIWAAAWLHQETSNEYYLKYVVDNSVFMGGTGWVVKECSWDNKYASVQTLLSKVVERRILELETSHDLSRIWLHIDMDVFYAAVVTLSNPMLQGKPMVVGSMSMLSTANYDARKFGVRSAMPGFITRKLCLELIFVPTKFRKYTHYSDLTRKVFQRVDVESTKVSKLQYFIRVSQNETELGSKDKTEAEGRLDFGQVGDSSALMVVQQVEAVVAVGELAYD
ncbi:unnamed protein product [Vicia faba]|uniref:cellulase n=1 Tax=Vicia faba TaxID=3906 RepID=A0AAV0Z7P4_VICFA|nr:unnamed protein product [Vicia faba]